MVGGGDYGGSEARPRGRKMSADLVAESTHGNLDEQIAQLMQCKPLSEPDVLFILFLFFKNLVDFLFRLS